jgi:hypothetical protein
MKLKVKLTAASRRSLRHHSLRAPLVINLRKR